MIRGALRTTSGKLGFFLLAIPLAMAIAGPLFAPNSPTAIKGLPAAGRGDGLFLGTDPLGRDVWSRILEGGRQVILLAVVATAIGYLIGMAIGLLAGFRGGWLDAVLMRGVDLWLSFPGIMFFLLLIAGLGNGREVLIAGTAALNVPSAARVIRTATLEAAGQPYVEVALGRGESTARIARHDILPTILPTVMADGALHLTFSILLIAAVNFLGLGVQPPDPDWAVMVAENRSILKLNPWGVVVPAGLLAVLSVGVNLVGDALAQSHGRSTP